MEHNFAPETTLELEISREANRIKIGTMRKTFGESETLRHYDEKEIDFSRIESKRAEIVRLLNNANLRGTLSGEIFEQLKNTGFSLFEELLSHDVQVDISSGGYDNLIINIDDGLVHIPWELLYEGSGFLCRKYCVGRVVRTRQKVFRSPLGKLRSPIKILIICDPAGDLAKAFEEGDRIRRELDQSPFLISADLFNTQVDKEILRENIRNYDMVHYAGHADYQLDNPSESGWLLSSSKLTSHDIIQLSRNLPMPALVFSNACQSGQTEEWKIEEGFENRIFGLANAFLLSGVQHYIGTFWEILDEASCEFSTSFYNQLLNGEAIGSAVKKAREHLVSQYGEETIIWASYMLYGNPGFKYFTLQNAPDERQQGVIYRDAHPYVVKVADSFPTGATRSLPPDRRTYSLVVMSYLMITLAVAAVVFFSWNALKSFSPGRSPLQPVATEIKADAEKTRHLLQALVKKYQEQKQKPDQQPQDQWTTQPLTMSLLGVRCSENIPEQQETERFFTAQLTKDLLAAENIRLVEREKLNAILEELQVTTSDIADQSMAVIMLGKLLGARLIATGEIIQLRGETSVIVRVFETDTSQIVITAQDELQKEWKASAEKIAGTIIAKIKVLYPIRGSIIQATKDEVVLNVGTQAGVKTGGTFSVLAPGKPLQNQSEPLATKQPIIGVITIRAVEPALSYATVQKQSAPFKEGSRVIEVTK